MPPADILNRIVDARRQRLGISMNESSLPVLAGGSGMPSSAATSPFVSALRAHPGRAVIAEVKLGSPRLGSLVERIDPEKQARGYADHGAAALSVVVEPDFFFGSYELLRRAKAASGLPAIAKDFLVSERQLDEAVAVGADAFLLIASLFAGHELRRWAAAVRERGMAPLIETHDSGDLAKLSGSNGERDGDWEMVGINNRDLRTFEVSLDASIALRSRIPAGALAVAESGIATRDDVHRLRDAGFDAFLIGESLLLAENPGARLEDLLS